MTHGFTSIGIVRCFGLGALRSTKRSTLSIKGTQLLWKITKLFFLQSKMVEIQIMEFIYCIYRSHDASRECDEYIIRETARRKSEKRGDLSLDMEALRAQRVTLGAGASSS